MNDPIRSVALARQGIERRGGVDAAAQQRFLAMLATVRPVELGDGVRVDAARGIEASGHVSSIEAPASGSAARIDGSRPESRHPREAREVERAIDAGQVPAAARAARAGSGVEASLPAMSTTIEPAEVAASRHQAGPRMRAADAGARGAGDGAAGHGVATPRGLASHGPAHALSSAARSPAASQQVAGAAVDATAMPSAEDMSSSEVVPREGARMAAREPAFGPPSHARAHGFEFLLLQGLPEARSVVGRADDAPREIPPAALEARMPAPRVDGRLPHALRPAADAAEGEADAGASADAPDVDIGALLRNISGAGAPLRAQRMADGSWTARLVVPGEGAVSIRISQSPELVSIRLGGDPELSRRVREAIEGGFARPGRRLAIGTTDAG
jgi:hypothetical protein